MEKYYLHTINRTHNDDDFQFGFRPNYSTNHATFVLRETILHYIRNNKSVYACFLDFSKAFDKINRLLLLEILKSKLDIDHWLTLRDYYSKSTIVIDNNNERSDPIRTSLGVKQGGPVSPKLFAIYVDALMNQVRNECEVCELNGQKTGILLYADDTSLLCPSIEALNWSENT
jgi:retron-type reverse transcriptase